MLKAPPLFQLAAAAPPAQPTIVGMDMASGPDRAAYHHVTAGFGPDVDADCWAIATRIANEVLDATTVAQIDAIKKRYADDIAALVAKRRDLALTVSGIFTDRRRELGGSAP
ncbi:MAG: hypothetical protein H7Y60_09715 [Rhodospirillaceae bacterium]|nr:hypothetical protein [Rhodospirillales bacterium]